MGKTELLALLEGYAASASLPVLTGVTVTHATPSTGGWRIETAGNDVWIARTLVVATATHQLPKFPAVKSQCKNVHHVHAADYRNPDQLPAGKVLVVGSGQSGVQIADELNRAGRNVALATSRVGRVPRTYRGRDVIAWQAQMGFLDRHAKALDSPGDRFRADPMLSGYDGGRTMDLRELEARGIKLAGQLQSATAEHLYFTDELADNIRFADVFSEQFEQAVNQLIAERDISAPRASPRPAFPTPCPTNQLSVGSEGIKVILWATGFSRDLSWLHAPVPTDSFDYPKQKNWHCELPGLHFLGFNYLEHRRSGILYGAGAEAQALANVLTANA
jgi:putative flavoprotein involved in K+ transport